MTGRILRFISVVLMALTVTFHVLGAVGSSCVALGAEKFTSMAPLTSYKWLYQLLALLTLAASIYGIKATFALSKGRPGSYKTALTVLMIVLVLSGIQMIASEILRGKSAPTNVRVYLTAFTLAVFLLLRIPKLWKKIGFDENETNSSGTSAGTALFLAGVMVLSVSMWAGPTHTIDGINYADAWRTSIILVGGTLVLSGVLALSLVFVRYCRAAERIEKLQDYG